ncbi:hypothetical protein H4R20_001625 [Coemansia guatemalensis]|uniref:Glycoside hydrolase family 19 catalytic domain-containing protein n=1 Tax=Coemansia guatemalensis TaxID=2761395 RepID=A0A9W8I1K0_9FUNG|nr:hypothetical protein H4R20_001625 [Coemansia guatemalensis]
MVSLTSAGSLLVATLAAGAQIANAMPQPQGSIVPKADYQHKDGDECNVQQDRITCADENSMLFCSNNKWVEFSACNPGTICKNGECVFPDESSAAEASSPEAQANDNTMSSVADVSSPVANAVPGASDAGATDAAAPSSAAVPTAAGATDAAATPAGASDAGASDAGASDTGATDAGASDAGASDAAASDAGASDAAATDAESSAPEASDESGSDAAESSSAGGSDSSSGGGGDFGINCDKFDEAVSKASEAIGQTYPKPSQEQCQSFLKGMPNGEISSAREAAMFLSNIIWESDGLRAKEEYECKDKPDWCAQNYKTPEDVPGQTYWGRGYIQLSWHYNYEDASKGLYNDERLAKDASQVSKNEDVAWNVSFWYWKANVRSDSGVQAGNFGSSINKINGALECKGAAQDKAKKRYEIYKAVLKVFDPNETPKETGCYN